MTIRADSFFIVPADQYDLNSNNFNLMPDNGDFLPLDIIPAVVLWQGDIYNPKQSTLVDGVVVPKSCFLVKCCLDLERIMSIKTQTTEFMSLAVYEMIQKEYPQVADIIANEAASNLTMYTVADLMIIKMYAGRNPQEVVWLWPELEGKFQDIIIM